MAPDRKKEVATELAEMDDHLTDYERAVCYYTLPKVSNPLTLGLIVAYCVCFLEALAAMCYGLYFDQPFLNKWGVPIFGVTVAFGVAAFFVRSLRDEIRKRSALAWARGIPDAVGAGADLPDPFAGHLLLRHDRHKPTFEMDVTDNAGETKYTVTMDGGHRGWQISNPMGELNVRVLPGGRSFFFDRGSPGRLSMKRKGTDVATTRRRFVLGAATTEINLVGGDQIISRGSGLFVGDKLVGRIYYIRRFIYLDIEEDSFHDGVLGFFVSLA